jgi:SulP family sulfate permease
MLVPQRVAYALLAAGRAARAVHASVMPQLAYCVFGTSQHLAVGPAALASLLVGKALAWQDLMRAGSLSTFLSHRCW